MGKNISYLLSLYTKNTEKRNLLQFKCKRFLKLMTLRKIKHFRAKNNPDGNFHRDFGAGLQGFEP